jgi:hypothetical protein
MTTVERSMAASALQKPAGLEVRVDVVHAGTERHHEAERGGNCGDVACHRHTLTPIDASSGPGVSFRSDLLAPLGRRPAYCKTLGGGAPLFRKDGIAALEPSRLFEAH